MVDAETSFWLKAVVGEAKTTNALTNNINIEKRIVISIFLFLKFPLSSKFRFSLLFLFLLNKCVCSGKENS